MGTLVRFTLLLCYMGSYLFHGGIGTMAFITLCPVFHCGKPRLVVVAVQGAPRVLVVLTTENAVEDSELPMLSTLMLGRFDESETLVTRSSEPLLGARQLSYNPVTMM